MCASVKVSALLWVKKIPLWILKQYNFVNELETLVLARGSYKMPKAHKQNSIVTIFMRLYLCEKGNSESHFSLFEGAW